ncbi:MAG: hypothetical protein V1913_00895 [Fibrobacterota bacterium]
MKVDRSARIVTYGATPVPVGFFVAQPGNMQSIPKTTKIANLTFFIKLPNLSNFLF